MKAEALTPAEIFGYHVRYVVPLFQRPYVWSRRDQWEPLWDDVRAVAERLLEPRAVAPHFLGAIVVEQAPTLVGSVAVYHVIDGQQRLTTLQLLLAAARQVVHAAGGDASGLGLLVRNETAVRREDEVAKVWPAIGDRDAFLATMGGVAGFGDAAVAQAYAYFVEAITDWAAGDPPVRLAALVRAVSDHLRAVVIHLDPGDNAQGIFETLNHRGAPLLAADLIKNLVFRIAEAQGLDVVALYQKYWSDLDGPFWRAYVRRGRQVVPRIDIFVNYWLVMRLVAEVRTDQIFAEFRDHLLSSVAIEDLLAELARDARTYAAIRTPATDTVPGRFCYRVLDAMDAGAVTPFYLWLMRWPSDVLPTGERDRALAAMESWVVRRWLAGLTSKDTSNAVLDLLKVLVAAGPAAAGAETEAFLLSQRAASRIWPGDHAVRKTLKTAAVDARLLRPRLRMLLEAIEDWQRTERSEGTACERDLTVEHVMPLGWRQHWAVDSEPAAAVLRDTLVHTLGNLTLVRWRLNHELANLPWTDAEAAAQGLGGTGKRSALASHSLLRINADLVANNPHVWTEESVTERTGRLADVALAVWARPSAVAPPLAPSPADPGSRPDPASRPEPGPGADAGRGRVPRPRGEIDPGRGSGRSDRLDLGLDQGPPDRPTRVRPEPDRPGRGRPARGRRSARSVDDAGSLDQGFDETSTDTSTESSTVDETDDNGRSGGRGRRPGNRRSGGAARAAGDGRTGGPGSGGRSLDDGGPEDLDESSSFGESSDFDESSDLGASEIVLAADDEGPDDEGSDDEGSDDEGSDDAESAATATAAWLELAGEDPEAIRSKYARLTEFLSAQRAATLPMTFQQLEDVMGAALPPSARTSIPYWSHVKVALSVAITSGGYRPSMVDLWNERVILARAPGRKARPVRRRPAGRRNRGTT